MKRHRAFPAGLWLALFWTLALLSFAGKPSARAQAAPPTAAAVVAPANATAGEVSAADLPADSPVSASTTESVAEFLAHQAAAHTWLLLFFSAAGALNAFWTPLSDLTHKFVLQTDTKFDDQVLAWIENSKVCAWIFYLLRLVGLKLHPAAGKLPL